MTQESVFTSDEYLNIKEKAALKAALNGISLPLFPMNQSLVQ